LDRYPNGVMSGLFLIERNASGLGGSGTTPA
jgi:hypothetical protein